MNKISIVISDRRWRAHIHSPRQWVMSVSQPLMGFLGLGPMKATLVLTSDEHIQSLNQQFRDKDMPTNVLSFPSDMPGYAGDVVMAFETCKKEADLKESLFTHHASHLLIHGVLHLLGYDHQSEADAMVMEGIEIQVLFQLGISNPYSEL